MRNLKHILAPSKNKSIFIAIVIGIALIAHYTWMFMSLYRVQSPVVIEFRPPVVSKFTSPVPNIKAEPIHQEKENKPVKVPSVTPTPTSKPKALKINLVKDVEASEVYGYETKTHIMDEMQLRNLPLVEARFGKEGTQLVFKESGLHNDSVNSESGACGLFQAYPCEKMGCELDDVECQLNWGETYITDRYGTPINAYKFWVSNGWY